MFKTIRSQKNRLKGEDIYILGNGPSIKNEDLSLLKGKHSIGMNASPLLEKEFGFVSEYYTVSDMRFLGHPDKRKMAMEMLNHETVRVFRKELREIDERSLPNETYYIESLGKNGFSSDLTKGFYFGASTTMLAIQLAAYLGCKRIFLMGVDLRYDGENPRFYTEDEVQEYDHFTSIQIWNIRNAYKEFMKQGREMYNCSYNSLLTPYLPFIDFNEVLINDNC